jgi:beta-glucosidase
MPATRRAEDLLERMTLEEKVAQLSSVFPHAVVGPAGVDKQKLDVVLGAGIGQLSGLTNLFPTDPAALVGTVDEIQHYLVEKTRLGIPALGHSEALSGLLHSAASNFPTAIALAATWAPERVEQMNGIVRSEARSLGVHQALSPVMDIARDARWGRIHETYGEDPYLCSAMAVAFVRGLQGEDLANGVVATGKHFVAYGLSEGGRNIGSVRVADRELYEVYCRPFEAAIRESALASVMNSYAEVNGVVPAAAPALLTDLLRGRMGFQGVVVADYGSVAMTSDRHEIADNRSDAGVMAVQAGLDMELPEGDCFVDLRDAVADGRLDEVTLNRSVRRVLETKFLAGVFENPYGDLAAFENRERKAGSELARELAQRSVVLLKNEDGFLPLSRDLRRLAVIGPHADSVRNMFSGYTAPSLIELLRHHTQVAHGADLGLEGTRLSLEAVTEEPAEGIEGATRALYPDTRTLLEAVRAKVGPDCEVLFTPGCGTNNRSV